MHFRESKNIKVLKCCMWDFFFVIQKMLKHKNVHTISGLLLKFQCWSTPNMWCTYTSRDSTTSCRLSGTLGGFPLRSPDRNMVWWGSSWEVEASCSLYLQRPETTSTLLERKSSVSKVSFTKKKKSINN